MPVTNKDGRLEAWLEATETLLANLEAIYGTVTVTPVLPSVTTYDGMLEAILIETEKMFGNMYELYGHITDDAVAYTKTVPNGAMPYASLDMIGGKTLVMNQQVDYTSIANSGTILNKLTWTNNGDGTFTFTGNTSASAGASPEFATIPNGHKFAVVGWTNSYKVQMYPTGQPTIASDGIYTQPNSNPLKLRVNDTTLPNGTSITLKPKIADLTLMFGAGNEPSTLEEFLAIFPNFVDESYNAGSLLSAGVTSVESVGKNIYDNDNPTIINGFLNSSGLPAGQTKFSASGAAKCLIIPVNPSTNYVWSYRVSDGGRHNTGMFSSVPSDQTIGLIPSATTETVDGRTYIKFTTDSTTKYIAIYYYNSNDGIAEDVIRKYIDVEQGTTATPYTPYKKVSYPIPADVQALTGYGWSAGTAYNYIDYDRKVFVQRVASVDLSTIGATYNTTWQCWSAFPVGNEKYVSSNNDAPNMVTANMLPRKTSGYTTSHESMTLAQNTSGTLLFDNGSNSSLTGTMYYELQTPIETDISAYLTDDNLIEVEVGGTLTFENQHGDDYRIPVPSRIIYDRNIY